MDRRGWRSAGRCGRAKSPGSGVGKTARPPPFARTDQPFVAGPNILFAQSRDPCRLEAEREICRAASCRMLFTESEWYRRADRRASRTGQPRPIVVWPYPIDPHPGGPLTAAHDLLIYEKSGVSRETVERLQAAWPRHVRIRYGRYRREELAATARRSRVCAYLSDDDRGPLALAEILLAGCAAVGMPRGRRLSSPAAPASWSIGWKRRRCRPPSPGVCVLIAARSPPRPPSGSTRRGSWPRSPARWKRFWAEFNPAGR